MMDMAEPSNRSDHPLIDVSLDCRDLESHEVSSYRKVLIWTCSTTVPWISRVLEIQDSGKLMVGKRQTLDRQAGPVPADVKWLISNSITHDEESNELLSACTMQANNYLSSNAHMAQKGTLIQHYGCMVRGKEYLYRFQPGNKTELKICLTRG